MALRKSKGNMYEFVTHTWNTIKGACPHDCSYCYMKKWGKQPELHFDEKELKTDLGTGNFIFVGSSCDMWAGVPIETPNGILDGIPNEWIMKTLEHCNNFPDNNYLFQSKFPRFKSFRGMFSPKSILGTTLECDRIYYDIMGRTISPLTRAECLGEMKDFKRFVTIEPIMDFDLERFVDIIKLCEPFQVNIGADSGKNNLPEPFPEKVGELIKELEKFTKVHIKKNLNRILNQQL